MNAFIVLLVVAVIITSITSKIKEYFDNISGVIKTRGDSDSSKSIRIKPSLYIALFVGVLSGIALQIGLVETLLSVLKVNYSLPNNFMYVDRFFACIALSSGSGWLIDILSKIKDILDQVGKILSALPKIKEYLENIIFEKNNK